MNAYLTVPSWFVVRHLGASRLEASVLLELGHCAHRWDLLVPQLVDAHDQLRLLRDTEELTRRSAAILLPQHQQHAPIQLPVRLYGKRHLTPCLPLLGTLHTLARKRLGMLQHELDLLTVQMARLRDMLRQWLQMNQSVERELLRAGLEDSARKKWEVAEVERVLVQNLDALLAGEQAHVELAECLNSVRRVEPSVSPVSVRSPVVMPENLKEETTGTGDTFDEALPEPLRFEFPLTLESSSMEREGDTACL